MRQGMESAGLTVGNEPWFCAEIYAKQTFPDNKNSFLNPFSPSSVAGSRSPCCWCKWSFVNKAELGKTSILPNPS